ncbi:MAG TPA: hypothetical protein DEA50_03755 [Parvularcula sp.]|nr:hypothetical protein [Parvularcula sp.]
MLAEVADAAIDRAARGGCEDGAEMRAPCQTPGVAATGAIDGPLRRSVPRAGWCALRQPVPRA